MLKVSVIGGGSTYTPELLNGFIARQDSFPLDELWLMDIDKKRLKILGEFSQRMAASKNARFAVVLSHDQKETIRDSAYVITQLRVGQMAARREDEYLGQRHGLIGQETTGVGGMAKALRTIPVILDIANDIQQYAPHALLVNFTNPSGLITEALFRYAPTVKSVGVCNATITTKMALLALLNKALDRNIQPEQVDIKVLGLNHLTWFIGLEVQGEDYWPQVYQAILEESKKQDDPLFDHQLLENLQMLPNSYLRYYYYTEKMLAEQNKWPPSRAEEVVNIERDLLTKYQNKNQIEPPDDLMKRGGAYYSTVATQLLNAHYNDLNETHVVNVRQNGAVAGWDKNWVLEMPCRVSSEGISPIPTSPLPMVCSSLLTQVKAYEILTAEAAVTGNRTTAYQALLCHPLGPSANKIEKVLEDLISTNQHYLEKFFSS